MWPFGKKTRISQADMEFVKTCMKQVGECASLVNTTTNAQVFFGRLHFLLDLLLEMQKYERFGIFQNSKPSADYKKVIRNMEQTVNAFIDRALDANARKISKYKTQAARDRNTTKFILELAHGFDIAGSCWAGNPMIAHYTGPLYTEKNRERIDELLSNLPTQ